MKKLPIGIQTFSEIIEHNYLYVDKTGIAVDLIEQYKYVFLSRPRRFGKSLFVDTLHKLFAGNKELFKGLEAQEKHDWTKKHPVIRISFGGGNFRSMERMTNRLSMILKENEERLGVACKTSSPDTCFAELIQNVAQKYKLPVVILIDEYDKPILDNMDQPEMAFEAREELKAFYSVIKDNDAHIRFAFLTGVSKFSKVSIFSGINNIVDISLNPKYDTICGYSKEELITTFSDHLKGVDMNQVRLWYDGYKFPTRNVYNPFDILLFIDNGHEYKNYWFETGTPTFLIKLLQKKQFFLPELNNHIKAGEELLSSFDIDNITPIPLLFQTGYLTITDVLRRDTFVSYTLGFPNLEVCSAFNNSLLTLFYQGNNQNEMQMDIYFALQDGDLETFKKSIHALFAAIPYHNYTKNDIALYEGFYASVVYAWLAASRLCLTVEDCTNKGRIDMSVETKDAIYIVEFKVDTKKGEALSQIKKKGYHEKYRSKNKDIIGIGITFSDEEKNVTEFVWEKL